jgi:hypothetical protein
MMCVFNLNFMSLVLPLKDVISHMIQVYLHSIEIDINDQTYNNVYQFILEGISTKSVIVI